MHIQIPDAADLPDSLQSPCVRRNTTVAEIVDKGIALQEKCGTKAAAEFLRRKMVNIEVAERVLLRHSERRDYSKKD